MLFPQHKQTAPVTSDVANQRRAEIDTLAQYDSKMSGLQFAWRVICRAVADARSIVSFLALLVSAFWPVLTEQLRSIGYEVTSRWPEDHWLRISLGIVFIFCLGRVTYQLREEVATKLQNAQKALADRERRRCVKEKFAEYMNQADAFLTVVRNLPSDEANRKASEWVTELDNFVERAIGKGEARQLRNHAGLVGFHANNVANETERIFVNHCLTRLGELMTRMDMLEIRVDFEPKNSESEWVLAGQKLQKP